MLGSIIIWILSLLAGFFIAAELVAKGTEELEPLIGQGLAGGVLLGLLGSTPETIFVIIAVLKGSFNIAIGSAIGGNLILFTLGMGVIAIVYCLKWKTKLKMKEDYRVELVFLAISTFGMLALILYGALNVISGLLLSSIYVAYLAYRYGKARHTMRKSLATKRGVRLFGEGLVYITIGMVMVAFLSEYFVDAITQLAGALQIAAIWLALVISPIAADLDETISGYRIATKNAGGGSTAVVSFLGSKLENNTILLGLIGILAGTSVSLGSASTELLIVIGTNIVAFLFVIRGRFGYREGMVLITLYFIGIAGALIF